MTPTVLFHGGCHGCSMQDLKGLSYCVGCQYFECEWGKPDLNDEHARRNEKMERFREMARKQLVDKI